LKENDSAHGFDDTRRKDVINNDTFVAERITGEDVSIKRGALKNVTEYDLEESMSGGDYESLSICPPHGDYDAYQIDIDYSNVLFKDIDMICNLDYKKVLGSLQTRYMSVPSQNRIVMNDCLQASMVLTKALALVITSIHNVILLSRL
jgi:hypothetical protein